MTHTHKTPGPFSKVLSRVFSARRHSFDESNLHSVQGGAHFLGREARVWRAAATMLLLVMMVGCGNLIFFRLRRSIPESRVEGSPIGGLLPVLPLDVPLDVDLEAEMEARNTGPVQGVYLESLRIDVTDTATPAGDEDDLGFIDTIDVYVECTSPCSLPTELAASVEGVADGATSVRFRTYGVDLKPYIERGARFVTAASGSIPPDDVTFDGRMTIRVEVL